MGLFNRNKKADSGGTAEVQSDPRKARRFFEHAQVVAASRQYDYAITCYINGLRYDPEQLQHHEALRDVALRRKVSGGKNPSPIEKMKYAGGKGHIEKMLNAEFLWAKDPFEVSYGMIVFENAVAARLEEVAYWAGGLVLEANSAAKKPSKQAFRKAVDLFTKIGAFDRAVEACKGLLAMDPGNMQILHELKNLEAELTLATGGYDEEDASFRSGIKDADKQRALEQEDAIARTASALEQTIERLRKRCEENPDDFESLAKLVRALLDTEKEEAEREAIDRLTKTYERTGQYRYKVQAGDVRIKQYNRRVRGLRQQIEKAEDESERERLIQQLKDLAGEQLGFELEEYSERVKNYPTDMGLRYQLGRRQFALGDYEAAIASLQEAQKDPKHRAQSLRYLGEAFFRKEWHEEAIDTYRRAIEIHPSSEDKLALDLRYELMRSLAAKARRNKDIETAEEASKVASQIAQTNINFKDIRQHVDGIRKLIDELRGRGSPAASA